MSTTYYPRAGVVSRYKTTVLEELIAIRRKLEEIFSLIGSCQAGYSDGYNGTMTTRVSQTTVTEDNNSIRAFTVLTHGSEGNPNSTWQSEIDKIRWYSGCIHGLLTNWCDEDNANQNPPDTHYVEFPDGRRTQSRGVDITCGNEKHIAGRSTTINFS